MVMAQVCRDFTSRMSPIAGPMHSMVFLHA